MKRTWHKGPPPHVGWWNASMQEDESCWRWWNGLYWSFPAWTHTKLEWIEERATTRSFGHNVKWTNHYPKNARVPRIAP